MKSTILVTAALLAAANLSAQTTVLKSKTIENGGTGSYKAIAVKESGLPDFVIYRPENLQNAVAKEGALPIVVYANGGCMNTSIHAENFLNEIASHGYVVVAIGEMQDKKFDREEHQ
ncbi:MAG: hypothetical protein K6F33_05625, partial [Bacteroidales bacterium]|nr:hypothetical protein [Bacteroidales bacterium]